MSFSKAQFCLTRVCSASGSSSAAPILLRITGRRRTLLFEPGTSTSSSNTSLLLQALGRRHFTVLSTRPPPAQLHNYLRRHYSLGRPPKSSLSVTSGTIITKDRLILLGIGVIVVGLLVGYEKYNQESVAHKHTIMLLHNSVSTAQNHVKDGSYEEAFDHYKKAKILVEQASMSSVKVQNKVILNIVDQLGHLAYELGNWEEAEIYLNETEKVMLQCGIQKHDDSYIEVILRLGVIDAQQDRQEIALERFNMCIKTLEEKISVQDIYSDEYSDRLILYGMALTEYGTYTKRIGLLDASERAFSKALNVCRSVLGPNHEQTSVLANDLATVYDQKGKFNKAIRLVEKAIKIASETAPGNLATYKYNLAHILMHKGDWGNARSTLRECLTLAEEQEDNETRELVESSIVKLELNVS